MMKMSSLQIASLIGLLIYFAVLLFAVSKDKKNTNVIDYFFAGRSLPFRALSITFIASWWGAGSAISTADLAYSDGLGAFWYYGVPVLLSTFLMILGAKAIRRVGYLTQGKMMAARYSQKVSKLLSVMILIFMTFSAASQMVGVGDFFGTYLGLNYELAVLVGTGIVLIYSLFGGFRGVVLTDIIQFVLLLLSAVAVFIVAFVRSGGFSEISAAAALAGKTDYMSLTSGASKYAVYVITFGCAWMIQANVWQRISAARSDGDARKMTVLSFFAYIPLYLMVVFTGMAGSVLFDTLPEGGVVTAIVKDYMHPLLGAIAFVGISAAIMSTMDSLINTGAMTLAIDLNTKEKDEDKKLRFSRMATLIVTAVALVISLGIRSILEISWIASDIITTGVFVPLVAGFIWRRGNSKGAMSSMIIGLVYCFYNLLLSKGVALPAFWQPQSAQQVIFGVALSAVTYIVVSLCTEPEYEKADAFIAMANLFPKRKKKI
jgi:SSS family solute:Na+ symporter